MNKRTITAHRGRVDWAVWRGSDLIAWGASLSEGLARQARNALTGRTLYNAALRRFRFALGKRQRDQRAAQPPACNQA